MKKLLTVLLTLVMAICLVNLNNSHTKADENDFELYYKLEKTSVTPERYTLHLRNGSDTGYIKDNKNGIYSGGTAAPWSDDYNKITKVVIENELNPTSTAYWFYLNILETIENISYIKTSAVSDMSYMFYSAEKLSNLDLSSFDTSAVKNMRALFSGCKALTSLNINGFDTSEVEDMGAMFSVCESLTNLDLSHFDTSKVTNMQAMFNGCKSLTSLDVSSFDTSEVTNMFNMFRNCLDLTNLNLSSFDTGKVENMQWMFYVDDDSTSDLSKIEVGDGWNTDSVTNSTQMFNNLVNLIGEKGTMYNGTNPKDKTYARVDGGAASPGYFTYVAPPAPPKPEPTPSPSKKDESCEKVIGPTWHWNNDKGICEDYGVVGTSTR